MPSTSQVATSRRRGERLLTVHSYAHRRIVEIADVLMMDVSMNRWYAVYGAALAREVHRKKRMAKKIEDYAKARERRRLGE